MRPVHPAARDGGHRFLPFVLIGLGLVFLASNVLPRVGRGGLMLIALGLVFLIGRLTTARYGYAVPAGLLIGVGSFVALRDAAGPLAPGWLFVLLGAGFGLVYVIGFRPAALRPLFGGALLVGLGLVSLGFDSLGGLGSLAWLASYWPLVLVAIGAWFLLRDHLPPAARRRVATAGTLVALGYALVAAAAWLAAGGALPLAAPRGTTLPASFSDSLTLNAVMDPTAGLTIPNGEGRTTVRGQADASGVHVLVTRHFASAPPDVRMVSTGGGGALLRVSDAGGGPGFAPQAWVDYEVEMPAATRLVVQAGSGDVDIDGLNGPVEVSNGSGSVRLSNLAGAVVVQSGSGSVDLTNLGGDLRLSSGSGSVRGTNLQHVREASTGNGSLFLTGVFVDAASIRTGNGRLELHLLPGSAVRVEARSQSGRVEVHDLPLMQSERTASGSVGGGSATLNVDSGSGAIVLSP
jgi:putative adhesin